MVHTWSIIKMLYIYFPRKHRGPQKEEMLDDVTSASVLVFRFLFRFLVLLCFHFKIWNVFQRLYLFLKPFITWVIKNTYLVIPSPNYACTLSSELRIWKPSDLFFRFLPMNDPTPSTLCMFSSVLQILLYNFFTCFDLKYILFIMIRVMFHAIVFDIFTFYMVFLHIKSFSKKETVVTLHNVTNLFFTIFTENEIIQTLRTFYYQSNLLSKWVFTVYFGFFKKSSILAWMHFTTVNLHNNLCLIRSLLENFTVTCQI